MSEPSPFLNRDSEREPRPRSNAAYAFASAFFDELWRAGLEHVVVCPGSRSTPLAVTAARRPEGRDLQVWSQVDERAAGFFALGIARATRRPAALVCTSGTAAANLLPAVVEAHYARVPLLVLSADRPPELREWGAGQTIDQHHLFGTHVRWFAELPVPPSAGLRYARVLACRAMEVASTAPAGVVHLNWPLREPLEPTADSADSRLDSRAWCVGEDDYARPGASQCYTRVGHSALAPTPEQVARVVELLEGEPRGVVLCGPGDLDADGAAAVAALAASAGWPLLADAASQLRCGPQVGASCTVACADLLLRDARFATEHRPAAVLRLGAPSVSKALRLWLEASPPRHYIQVDPDGVWEEPSFLVSELLRVDPALLCRAVARRLAARPSRDSGWLRAFASGEATARRELARGIDAERALLEPGVVHEIAAALPPNAMLYVSNSMPIRDLDTFLPVSPTPLRVLCNRGANGIDGMVSSALGVAAATSSDAPVVLLTGDLALLHDLGGLLAARRHGLRLSVVALNNDGGGIFSYLPIAQFGESAAFEELFRTPHGLDLRPAAELFGASFRRVRSRSGLQDALTGAFESGGSSLIEVPIDRDASLRHHRALAARVSKALWARHPGEGLPA